jgi:chromate transporter
MAETLTMRDNDLLNLMVVFVPFSLLSFGGGSAIIAGIQHESVLVRHWVTPQEFIDLFAISRAAPGPGTMLATLIGWKVAGWTGAIVATLSLILPSSVLFYTVLAFTNTHREKKWHKAVSAGLAPIGIGLIIAGAISLFRLSNGGLMGAATVGISAFVLNRFPRVPTVAVLFLGVSIALTCYAWGQLGLPSY